MQTTAAHQDPAGSSIHNAHAAWDTAGHQAAANGHDTGRQTRSRRSQDRGEARGHRIGAAAATLAGAAGGSACEFIGGGDRDGGAGVQGRDEQQHQQMFGGRALRSRRGQAPLPDEAQLQSDDDAQLAQALQESLLSAPPVRRSGRNSRPAEQHSGHEGRSEEAAGPSHAADQMSPSSSRETRAQQRASRLQQMHTHKAMPEPVDEHMAEPENQSVRRSQRQQTRASSASAETSQRVFGAAQITNDHLERADRPQDSVDDSDTTARGAMRQGASGIKLTLRRTSSATRQCQEDPADVDAAAPANGGRSTTGLRVSLRPRRS